jgi:hypothetical protein
MQLSMCEEGEQNVSVGVTGTKIVLVRMCLWGSHKTGGMGLKWVWTHPWGMGADHSPTLLRSRWLAWRAQAMPGLDVRWVGGRDLSLADGGQA